MTQEGKILNEEIMQVEKICRRMHDDTFRRPRCIYNVYMIRPV